MANFSLTLRVAYPRFKEAMKLVAKEFGDYHPKRELPGYPGVLFSGATEETRSNLVNFMEAKGWDYWPKSIPHGKNDKYENSGKWFFISTERAAPKRKAKIERVRAVKSPKTKTKGKPKLDDLLKVLKACVKNRKGATEAQIRSAGKGLPCPIPPAWQKVMKAVDGGAIRTSAAECEEFDMSKAKDFAKNNGFARKFIKQGWPKLPESYLAVVANENQDFIFLDTSKINARGDCPAVLIDHEECRIQKKWASITKLLEYVLAKALII